jgi:tryptophanyl-tRNA synthetase
MSKSFDNAIYLSDSPAQIRARVAKLPTGRSSKTAPGDPDNVLFQYARAFMTDATRVRELADRYARGDDIGDGEIKAEVATAIDALIQPMRERRAQLADAHVLEILRAHSRRANTVAEDTLARVKSAMHLDFGRRELTLV